MKRRITVVILCAMLFAISSPVEAQQKSTTPRIGWLGVRPDDSTTSFNLFRQELGALGYVEGKNIAFEYRSAQNNYNRLPALADELVRLKVAVIFTPAVTEARAAKNATRTIPIVFISSDDPVAAGLVDSLARPGGNLTGFTPITRALAGKRLELLKDIIPKLSHVAVLWDPRNPGAEQSWNESQPTARELRLQLHSMEVSSAAEFELAFQDAVKAGCGALSVTLSPLINSNQKQIADQATKNRLPAVYSRAEFVNSGGLMSYGPDRTESYRRAASMVDKILKGRKPADLPVEQTTKFEVIINLSAAKQIGLTIPPNVLARADKVIR